ncbi:MAG: peptidoglycan-binding domain-containing protein [Cyanobacteria bacterium P01_D01_bin.44]
MSWILVIGEFYMTNSPTLVHHAIQYRDIVKEYCEISAKLTLNDADADRIAEILGEACDDAMLSFLIDEADHMLAHWHHLIDDAEISQTQQKLQQSFDQVWLEQLLLDISTRMQASQRKTLQLRLKNLGFYTGPIDGIVGPQTEAALKNCSDSGDLCIPMVPIHTPNA